MSTESHSEVFDVAIVGGGPAGCSAAIVLARQGANVVLFESKTYPHHKVCGEFLSPECSGELDQLGVWTSLQALNPIRIDTARIVAPDGTNWKTTFPTSAWSLSRNALDAALAQHAESVGVVIREATTVRTIEGRLADGFTVAFRSHGKLGSKLGTVRTRAVIAAHGKRDTLDRTLKRSFLEAPQPYLGLKAHFQGKSPPNRIELYSFRGGYCGLSEVETGAINVCLLAHASVLRRVQHESEGDPTDIHVLLQWMQKENPQLGQWLSTAEPLVPAFERWLSIGQVSFARKQRVINDIVMTGDAAGLIVPLAGDGIAMALRSGRLAAECVASFLAARVSPDAMTHLYAQRWRREFASRLRLGRALQPLMLHPTLFSVGLKAMIAVPPFGDYLWKQTRGSNLA